MLDKDYYHTDGALNAEQIARGITEVNDRLLMRPDYVSFAVNIDGQEYRLKATSIMAMAGGGTCVSLEHDNEF